MESGNGIFGYLDFLQIIVPFGVVNWYWTFFFSNCLLVSNARYSCLGHSVVSRETVKSRTYFIMLAVIGLFVLALGSYVLENGLLNDRIVKVENLQYSIPLTRAESDECPVYAYPNEGVGSVEAGYFDMYILVDYSNVNSTYGTLRVEDYYPINGSINWGHPLDSKVVTGSGSVVFIYSYSYVGLHWIVVTSDYFPGWPPIEVSIYTVHYALSYKVDIILYGVLVSIVGTILASIGLSVAVYEIKHHE